jgi:hypothetical protein
MTAEGKITASRIQHGDIVLLEEIGDEWRPATRKGKTTTPVRIVGRETVQVSRHRARIALRYVFVQLDMASTEPVTVAPSQTFWLASASRYWARYLAGRGILPSR